MRTLKDGRDCNPRFLHTLLRVPTTQHPRGMRFLKHSGKNQLLGFQLRLFFPQLLQLSHQRCHVSHIQPTRVPDQGMHRIPGSSQGGPVVTLRHNRPRHTVHRHRNLIVNRQPIGKLSESVPRPLDPIQLHNLRPLQLNPAPLSPIRYPAVVIAIASIIHMLQLVDPGFRDIARGRWLHPTRRSSQIHPTIHRPEYFQFIKAGLMLIVVHRGEGRKPQEFCLHRGKSLSCQQRIHRGTQSWPSHSCHSCHVCHGGQRRASRLRQHFLQDNHVGRDPRPRLATTHQQGRGVRQLDHSGELQTAPLRRLIRRAR